jgi:vitamin B12 transporter
MRMIVRITKRFAKFEVFQALKTFGKLSLLCLPLVLNSQTTDTTQYPKTLPSLTIRDARFNRTGYTFWKADSLPLNGAIALSDRLLWENRLDVRANAPGTLSTISIRGAGPNRTPVFWNGLNLQSPMNGVMDVSLLPLWPDDNLEIQYGGQSAVQSSGAMGGSVLVTPRPQAFEQGFSGYINAVTGSFGRLESSASAGLSGKKTASTLRAAWQQADNDFSFQKQGLDGRYYAAKQGNNFGKRIDLQQFNRLEINNGNELKTAFWFQNAFREIPPSITEAPRETWQKDRSYRAVLSWEHAANSRTLWTTRAAWLDDFLAFNLVSNVDTSHSRQAMLSTERSSSIGKHWAWRIGGTALRQWAQVDGYSDSTQWFGQTRLAGYTMGEWHRKDTRISGLFRQEWAEAQAAPFTGSIGVQQELGKAGGLRFHLSRNFNLPTLNDRFWKNLGNTDLRPEKGYSTDIGWVFQASNFSLEVTGFQLVLDDWILWQPDSTGQFRPNNLRKVWSRGIEGGGKWQVSRNKWKVDVSGRMQVSKTTNVAVYDGVEGLGRQLAYTPRFSGGFSARISRGIVSVAYLQQFTGERLDNGGKAVKAFQIGNLLVSCAPLKGRLTVDFRLENIWNAQYEIIRYRPMPGRNWRIGVGYRW